MGKTSADKSKSLATLKSDGKQRILWLARKCPSTWPTRATPKTAGWDGLPRSPYYVLDSLLANWRRTSRAHRVLSSEEKALILETVPWWKRRLAAAEKSDKARGRLTKYIAKKFRPEHHEWKDDCAERFLLLAETARRANRAKRGDDASDVILVLDAPRGDGGEHAKRLRVCDTIAKTGSPLKALVVDTNKDVVRAATDLHSPVVAATRILDVTKLTHDDLPNARLLAGAYLDMCNSSVDKVMHAVHAALPLLDRKAALVVTMTGRSYVDSGSFGFRAQHLEEKLLKLPGFQPVGRRCLNFAPHQLVATLFLERR